MLTNSNPYLEQRLTYIHCNKRLATFPSPAGFFSSLPNWDSTTPLNAGVCVPSGSEGETHSLGGGGVGGHNSDVGTSRHCGTLGILYMFFVMEPYVILSLSLSIYLCGLCSGTTRTCCRTTAASCTGAPWRAGVPSHPVARGRRRRTPRHLPTRPPPPPAPPPRTSSGTEPALQATMGKITIKTPNPKCCLKGNGSPNGLS
jgi:hypothetical protein